MESRSQDDFISSFIIAKKMFDVEINKEAVEIKSLYAKNVVLTGALSVFIGTGAVKMVTERGVVRQKGVTKKTCYVIAGDFTNAMNNSSMYDTVINGLMRSMFFT